MAKMPYAVKTRTAAVNQRSKCRQTEVLFISGSQIYDFNPSIVEYRLGYRKSYQRSERINSVGGYGGLKYTQSTQPECSDVRLILL